MLFPARSAPSVPGTLPPRNHGPKRVGRTSREGSRGGCEKRPPLGRAAAAWRGHSRSARGCRTRAGRHRRNRRSRPEARRPHVPFRRLRKRRRLRGPMLFPARSAPVGAGHITAPGITARSASAARPGKALAAGVKSVRHWDARQLLGEAIREALAVVGRVQDAIDVIEGRGPKRVGRTSRSGGSGSAAVYAARCSFRRGRAAVSERQKNLILISTLGY